jgi:hypothetical protein
MSRQYKDELLKDIPLEGQMLYGIETPAEIAEGYSENPLCERQVYKSKRRDKIQRKKQDKNKNKREKAEW